MFEEVEKLLIEIHDKAIAVGSAATYAGDYFRALALADCYNKLIEFADERTQQHPEVQRVPELRTLLLSHLIKNADRHIDARTERIFNPLLLGSPKSLREWQESGFRTKRTAANYNRRLAYWKAIYDEAPLIHQVKVTSGDDLFSGGIAYQSKFSTKRISRRQKTLAGTIEHHDISYEDIIHARNTNYSATNELVPWWEVLNYGSTFAGLAGYPSTPGLHFVEDAEKLVPTAIRRALSLFDQYMDYVFSLRGFTKGSAMLNIEQWASTKISSNNQYIPAADLARILTFGVPF